jgi:hypothetical protein
VRPVAIAVGIRDDRAVGSGLLNAEDAREHVQQQDECAEFHAAEYLPVAVISLG